MTKYLISNKTYNANNEDELLTQIKNENSNTKDLSLDNYINKFLINIINNTSPIKVSPPLTSSNIVKIWHELGILKKINA